MGVTPGRVSQIEHGEVSTVEAPASYIAALGGKLELVADIGGHLRKDASQQRVGRPGHRDRALVRAEAAASSRAPYSAGGKNDSRSK